MTTTQIRALAVDDNIIVRAGLITLLEANGEVQVIGEAGNGKEAIDKARNLMPDVTLLDVRMPLLDGVGAVEKIVEFSPVLMLTHTEDPNIIQESLRRGASGYLVHGSFTAAELNDAVHKVVSGQANPMSPVAVRAMLTALRGTTTEVADVGLPGTVAARLGLSLREAEVFALMGEGLSNSAIAERLFVAEKTVKNHVTHIYTKLDISSRAAAVVVWNRQNRPPADST